MGEKILLFWGGSCTSEKLSILFRRITVSILALLLGVLLRGPGDAEVAPKDPAHEGLPCAGCHAKGIAPLSPGRPNFGSCVLCHSETTVASHPLAVVEDRRFPISLPLGPGRSLTCGSCHELRGERHQLLRPAAEDPEFCESCHETATFTASPDQGAALRGRAHLSAHRQDWKRLDPFSLSCLPCHWEQVELNELRGGLTMSSEHGITVAGHPMTSLYEEAASYGGYRALKNLAEEIYLPRGRLSCLSCHRGYSLEHGKLRQPRRGLCSECHQL